MSKKTENGIQMYFHCKNCISKGIKDSVAVGWTIKGIQVWCDTCNTNIVALDFKGLKVSYDDNPNEKPNSNSNKDIN